MPQYHFYATTKAYTAYQGYTQRRLASQSFNLRSIVVAWLKYNSDGRGCNCLVLGCHCAREAHTISNVKYIDSILIALLNKSTSFIL
jgi:hypothetical protein